MRRIAVYLCRCFGEIDQIIDLNDIRVRLAGNSRVRSSAVVDSLCCADTIKQTALQIGKTDADQVLIAACSLISRGNRVIRTLEEEGIRSSSIHLVDIREGCAWIHGDDAAGATEKAYRLVDMGLALLEHKRPSDNVVVTVRREALIIGAGPAGMAAAVSLAERDIHVHLIERGSEPGGMPMLFSRVYPGNENPSIKLKPYREAIETNRNIAFYPRSKLVSVVGYVGDFKVCFVSNKNEYHIRPGVIIAATGARVFLPDGLYRYGELKNVITQMELETRFKKGTAETDNTVFIQCVGARCAERPYCSTICCPSAIKNALRISERNEDAHVVVLHRDVMTPGSTLENYYRTAMERGIRFIRFTEDTPPVIIGEDRVEAVDVYDVVTGLTRRINADLAVLSTPLIPGMDSHHLADMLGIQVDRYGFFREMYPMHPVETRMDGVFICGSARWPVSSDQAVMQGEAAAIKALAVLRSGKISASSFSPVPGGKFGHPNVNADSCTGCGNCMAVCPFDAIRLQRIDGKYFCISRVNKMRCKACGNCVSVCPNGTMQMPEHNYLSVCGMIERAFGQ